MARIFVEKKINPTNPWKCEICGKIPDMVWHHNNVDYCLDCWQARNIIKP